MCVQKHRRASQRGAEEVVSGSSLGSAPSRPERVCSESRGTYALCWGTKAFLVETLVLGATAPQDASRGGWRKQALGTLCPRKSWEWHLSTVPMRGVGALLGNTPLPPFPLEI